MQDTITAEQAEKMAQEFNKTAAKFDQFIDENIENMERIEFDHLRDHISILLRKGFAMRTKSVGLILERSQVSAASLIATTEKAKEKVDTLQTIGEAIVYISLVVALAGSIVSKDPKGIADAVVAIGTKITA